MTPSSRSLLTGLGLGALALLAGCTATIDGDPQSTSPEGSKKANGVGGGSWTGGAGGTGGQTPSGGAPSSGGSNAGGSAGSGGSGQAGSGGTAPGSSGGAWAGGGTSSGGSTSSGGGTSSGGSTSSGGGTGSSCPSGSAPPGPYAARLDVATLNCGSSGTCSPGQAKCFCQPEFDALLMGASHFMSVGTDSHKAEIWNAGDVQSVYVNDLNTNVAAGGAQRAADALSKAQSDFPCGVPKWFVVNEISAGLWPSDASYRQFVIDFAKAMNAAGKTAIVAAPFAAPGSNDASWTELAKYAFIGVENYVTGAEINAHANSVSWCQSQYQASITAYTARGVPKSRLYLFEHFGNTAAGTAWGRSGASAAGWQNAIKARSTAIKNLGFAGFLSYGWANNDMGVSEQERLDVMSLYASLGLP